MKKHQSKGSFSIRKAHETQVAMSKKITFEDALPRRIHLAAGVDVAYCQDKSIGAVAVLDYESLKPVESKVSVSNTAFPYIPTLLSFREISPAISSIRKLETSPDVFLVDGQGFAHPYRCGFASHLGLVINRSTIGVAKSRLIGEVEAPSVQAAYSLLKDRGEVVGAVVSTRRGGRPLYVSIGHKISLKRAIEVVSHCTCESRIPKPILEAHKLASDEKRKNQ